MDDRRRYVLRIDLTDTERWVLSQAAEKRGERFVDFVRRLAVEGALSGAPGSEDSVSPARRGPGAPSRRAA